MGLANQFPLKHAVTPGVSLCLQAHVSNLMEKLHCTLSSVPVHVLATSASVVDSVTPLCNSEN